MEITADYALLRHSLATLAYRASRALDEAPEDFATYPGAGKKPLRILAHMGDLMDWALSMAEGQPAWHEAEASSWVAEQQRFFAALTAFDRFLASGSELKAPAARLLQGPVADALTHVGQLAMLRRVAGCPAWGENFYIAEIHAGQTGAEQPAPVKKFR
ncbi:MAG: hypothetical protein P4K83_03775 [Terracidiphilus sp.]|nr:hypothetical protein [Terracidiphilus sp.]